MVAFSGLSLFTFPLEYAGNIAPAVRRCQQARDKQIDWFMDYLEPETKDACLADKKNPPLGNLRERDGQLDRLDEA